MARRGIKPGDRPKDPPASDTAFWDRVRKAQEMLAQGDLRQPPNDAAPAPLASGY
jgi:hypothetical protein